jgi:disulfide bond formation protein DsbB
MLELLSKNQCRLLYTMLICISITALMVAYYAEYQMNLDPCPLCIYQRIAYFVMIKLLLIFVLLVACLLAGYHSGVERGVFQANSKCKSSIDIPDNLSVNEIKKILYDKPVGSCSKPALVIFGFSMTEWNMFFNIMILVIVILVWLEGRKDAKT